jgi:hypothetical protein
MKYMVSYDLGGIGNCGNQTFDTLPEVEAYIAENKSKWVSAALLTYVHTPPISNLHFVKQIVERQAHCLVR